MKKRLKIILLPIALLSISYAAIRVQPIVLNQIPNANIAAREDLTVTNSDKQTEYVVVTPMILLNAGTKKEKTIKLDTPEELRKYGLFITPRRLIIPAKQSKDVRIGFINSKRFLNEAQIFHVRFDPVNASTVKAKSNDKNQSVGVKVLISYTVVVFKQPLKPNVNVQAVRSGDKITFMNKGNVSVFLSGITQCTVNNICTQVASAHRLYKNNNWSVTLKRPGPVRYSVIYIDQKNTHTST